MFCLVSLLTEQKRRLKVSLQRSFLIEKLFRVPTLILALHLSFTLSHSLTPAQCQHELYLVAPLSCSCYSFPNSKGTHDTMSSHLRNHINNKLHRLFRKWISYLEAHEQRWKAENLPLATLRSWNWSHPDVKKEREMKFYDSKDILETIISRLFISSRIWMEHSFRVGGHVGIFPERFPFRVYGLCHHPFHTWFGYKLFLISYLIHSFAAGFFLSNHSRCVCVYFRY